MSNVTYFSLLKNGQHFRWAYERGPSRKEPILKKVSARCYAWAMRPWTGPAGHFRGRIYKTCFHGSKPSAPWRVREVVPLKRSSPIRKRRGINRGAAVLAGLKRRR